jgi:hypothetical protein
MFKPNVGRKQESGVWDYFEYELSVDKSKCKAANCTTCIKGKNATNLMNHLLMNLQLLWRNEAPLAQDLLLAPALEAYVERVFSVCGDLTMGKRNRLTKSLEQRTFLKVNYKYYASTVLHRLRLISS